jgi:hypothetical protein
MTGHEATDREDHGGSSDHQGDEDHCAPPRRRDMGDGERLGTSTVSEVPRAFRTAHPLGWTIWKGEVIAPTEEELLTGIQG